MPINRAFQGEDIEDLLGYQPEFDSRAGPRDFQAGRNAQANANAGALNEINDAINQKRRASRAADTISELSKFIPMIINGEAPYEIESEFMRSLALSQGTSAAIEFAKQARDAQLEIQKRKQEVTQIGQRLGLSNPPIVQTGEGEFKTQGGGLTQEPDSFVADIGGRGVVLPRNFDGQELSEEDAIRGFQQGDVEAIGQFESVEQAQKAQQSRQQRPSLSEFERQNAFGMTLQDVENAENEFLTRQKNAKAEHAKFRTENFRKADDFAKRMFANYPNMVLNDPNDTPQVPTDPKQTSDLLDRWNFIRSQLPKEAWERFKAQVFIGPRNVRGSDDKSKLEETGEALRKFLEDGTSQNFSPNIEPEPADETVLAMKDQLAGRVGALRQLGMDGFADQVELYGNNKIDTEFLAGIIAKAPGKSITG